MRQDSTHRAVEVTVTIHMTVPVGWDEKRVEREAIQHVRQMDASGEFDHMSISVVGTAPRASSLKVDEVVDRDKDSAQATLFDNPRSG